MRGLGHRGSALRFGLRNFERGFRCFHFLTGRDALLEQLASRS
jgi:hypothetical protein